MAYQQNRNAKHVRKPARKHVPHNAFNPLVFALDMIKKYVSAGAYIDHHKGPGGRPVIRYRQVTGSRLTLGYNGESSRLVLDNKDCVFTEQQARTMCEELGVL